MLESLHKKFHIPVIPVFLKPTWNLPFDKLKALSKVERELETRSPVYI